MTSSNKDNLQLFKYRYVVVNKLNDVIGLFYTSESADAFCKYLNQSSTDFSVKYTNDLTVNIK